VLGFVNYIKGSLDSQPHVIKLSAASTTKTGRHDIAEILMKHQKIKRNGQLNTYFIGIMVGISHLRRYDDDVCFVLDA
jgi:hypothetical protein